MRKLIAAGNWKMNLGLHQAKDLVSAVLQGLGDISHPRVDVLFAPPYPYLGAVHGLIGGKGQVLLAGQNMHQEEKGAYTGEVSGFMLKEIGASHCLIGHSERRSYFHESNQLLAAKVNRALEYGLSPVYCIGETLEQREAGQTLLVNESQIREGLFHLDVDQMSKVTIAYEPVWAIGTGVTATPGQAQEVHAFIRQMLKKQYGEVLADNTTVLYGGSVKPANADELFAQPDIDGGLVGGASLKPADFLAIIRSLAASAS